MLKPSNKKQLFGYIKYMKRITASSLPLHDLDSLLGTNWKRIFELAEMGKAVSQVIIMIILLKFRVGNSYGIESQELKRKKKKSVS